MKSSTTPKNLYDFSIQNEEPKLDYRLQLFSYKLIPNKKSPKSSSYVPIIHLKNSCCTDNHVVIYSHGNASDLSDVFSYIQKLSLLYNINFIAYDYRGYGIQKTFKPSEGSTFEDIETVLTFSNQYLKYDLEKTFLWGYSLGSGPTIDLSSRFQSLGGVILQSPLASVMCWIDSATDWDFAYKQEDIYCNLNKIENIKAKIFIIHGRDDATINVKHSLMLYDKYVKSKADNNQIWLIIADGFGHNDLHEMLDDESSVFSKKLNKFLRIVKYCNKDKRSLEKESESLAESLVVDPEEEMRVFYKMKEEKSLALNYERMLLL